MSAKKRILTGDNTTGKLHIGHYVGSLENRVKLQDEYETFIILADMHAYAYPKYVENPKVVSQSILEVAIGNLAVGLDPKKVTMYVESLIPEVFELALIFTMLVSHNRALRNPTIKDEIREKQLGDNFSLGFLNFPVLMAADILGVNADLVPVGEDQLPHIELTREIARRFNHTYKPVFKEPEAKIGRIARLVGLDGNAKMSKSLDNTIYLNEEDASLKKKIMSMYTDPNRLRATDKGTVEGNPVFIYHDAFNSNIEEVADLKDRYEKGTVGDVEVKEKLFFAIKEFIEPIRERYFHYESNLDEVKDILQDGTARTRREVQGVLNQVRDGMQLPLF
ncbi:MAG: tryptophan--tRNA ligase [Patescibacteria group bacterium]